MLLDKEVEIKAYGKNFKYYKNLGYNIKFGEILKIDIKDLKKGSNIKVNVCCYNCKVKKKIVFKDYYKATKNKNKYYCTKCKSIKSKKTNLKKWGVDNPAKNKEIKDKIKQTNLKKWGTECTLNNEKVKNKTKQTLLNNFSVNNISKLKVTQDKINETNLKKYGVNRPLKNNKIKEKLSNYFLEKIGEKTPLLNKEIQQKISKTYELNKKEYYKFNLNENYDIINYKKGFLKVKHNKCGKITELTTFSYHNKLRYSNELCKYCFK